MKIEMESIVLQNERGQRLRIYKVEGSEDFCIGVEGGDQEHFEFSASDAVAICDSIGRVVDGS